MGLLEIYSTLNNILKTLGFVSPLAPYAKTIAVQQTKPPATYRLVPCPARLYRYNPAQLFKRTGFMELNQKEINSGYTWLVCAGGVAILFSLALYLTDNYKEGSTLRDRQHNAELQELRGAQASLAGRVSDERQLLPLTIDGDGAPAKTVDSKKTH
jgi:hypothetical protein